METREEMERDPPSPPESGKFAERIRGQTRRAHNMPPHTPQYPPISCPPWRNTESEEKRKGE